MTTHLIGTLRGLPVELVCPAYGGSVLATAGSDVTAERIQFLAAAVNSSTCVCATLLRVAARRGGGS